MSQEIEEIKKILINYDPTLKKALDIGLVDSKSVYDLEEFLNEIINNKLTNSLEIMDIVLIVQELQKLEEKKFKMLKETEEEQQILNHKRTDWFEKKNYVCTKFKLYFNYILYKYFTIKAQIADSSQKKKYL